MSISLLLADVAAGHSMSTGVSPWVYAGFLALVGVFLALDLGVFHRKAHAVSMREAVSWSIVWVVVGLSFSAFVYFAYQNHWLNLGVRTPVYGEGGDVIMSPVDGARAAGHYLTGYIVELSLAMDNLFVIALIFTFFAVPAKYQHRVLFWGIIGALAMRGAMIGLGSALILRYQWILIIFGVFLLVTALKMALIKGNDDLSQNFAVRIARKMFPISPFLDGPHFFTRRTLAPTYAPDPVTGEPVRQPPPAGTLSKKLFATPLFLALVMVEFTDLIFAVDSIPAVFAITPDPFIVFTSNIFAVMGLRSFYFCLAALIQKFRFLKPALILILAFVGVKLLLLSLPPYLDNIGGVVGLTIAEYKAIKIDTVVSLVVIVSALAIAVLASVILSPSAKPAGGNPDAVPPAS